MKLLFKDLLRTIQKTKGRFLAIAGICALGIGFFAGLQMTCGDMQEAVTDYYNNTNFMDIHVVSSAGLDEKNINDFLQVDGVEAVMPSRTTDILTSFGNDQAVVRLHSLSESAYSSTTENNKVCSDDNNYINRQILIEGNWPQNYDECVLSADIPSASLPKIGDCINVVECSNELDKTLKTNKFKVVGFVKSSYYVGIVQMGPSQLGKGIVNDYAYIPQSAFIDDFPYTEAFITVKGAKEFTTGTNEYQNHVDQVMGNLTMIAPQQAQIRTASIKSTAQEKIDLAKKELEEQKQKAFEQLDQAQAQLIESKAQLEDGQAQYDLAYQQYTDGYSQFYEQKNSAISQIDQGISQVNELVKRIENLYKKTLRNINDLELCANLINEPSTAKDGLDKITSALNTSVEITLELKSMVSTLPDFDVEITYIIDTSTQYLNFLISLIPVFKDDLENNPEKFAIDLMLFNSTYHICNLCLTGESAALELYSYYGQEQLDELQNTKSQVVAEFDKQELPLIDVKAQLDSSLAELNNGWAQYNNGYDAYIASRNQAIEKFKGAQAEIDSGEKQVSDIKNTEFFIMDRTKNFGAINFHNDALRIANIANVFPLLFFFVALLVALTSMTRMIDEERITIGTYKALGYSKFKISLKYILYGFVSSFVGSVIGVLILSQFLPWVIMYAYSIMYKLPIPLPMSYDLLIACLSVFLGVATTLIATLFAAIKTLSLQPSRLMIPTAPKAGKRILLEYIKPVWNLLNFNWKITFRNMFLYKRRLFMTIVGIAGCTALLLTGFGLHDSISDILDKQFDEITFDNYRVVYDSNQNEDVYNNVSNTAKSFNENARQVLVYEQNLLAQPEGYPNQSTTLCVPKDIEVFQDLRMIRDRNTKKKMQIKDDEIYISEKLAKLMGVKVGDTIEVYNQDLIGNAGSDKYTFLISGIFENYIAHYIYMTKNTYKKYFNQDYKPQNLIGELNTSNESKQKFIDNINSMGAVESAYFNDTNRETYDKMLDSVNMVVVILIIAAGILAFVVLYNLININICERAREIATLKVLGTRATETYLYVHRETILLSILGTIFGILLGFIMEFFVISSAEVDYVMFGRNIYWWSIALSIGITLFFTVLVALFMRKKLSSISMVESLKSIE